MEERNILNVMTIDKKIQLQLILIVKLLNNYMQTFFTYS